MLRVTPRPLHRAYRIQGNLVREVVNRAMMPQFFIRVRISSKRKRAICAKRRRVCHLRLEVSRISVEITLGHHCGRTKDLHFKNRASHPPVHVMVAADSGLVKMLNPQES